MLPQSRWLLLETSGRTGRIGLVAEGAVVDEVQLDSGRQHARDLAPHLAALLSKHHCRASDLAGIAVSLGPGSYTGLRVGVMTAKTLAYAGGCRLIGIPTFAVIANQAPPELKRLAVMADALKGKVYIQKFQFDESARSWVESTPLSIQLLADCLPMAEPVSGPGARLLSDGAELRPESEREPGLQSLCNVALSGIYADGQAMTLEPIYLRPSSAEEQWDKRPTQSR